MTAEPVSLAPVTTLRTASDMMVEHHCHSLPVVENVMIAGILTTRDVARSVSKNVD